DLHRRHPEVGLRVQKRGRGLAITDVDRPVKASYLHLNASLNHLNARLGRFQPPEPPREPDPLRRWREIRELRETAAELARHQQAERDQTAVRVQARTAQQARERHDRRVAVASRVLDERLAEVYRDPAAARRALDHAVRAEGLEKATRRLAQEPERFGQLHGRGGLLANAKRWAAIEAAPHAATAARDLQTVRTQARGGARSQPATRAIGSANRARRLVNHVQQTARRLAPAARRDEAFLERNASNLVTSLGWTVAARVLNPAQYYLLRAAVTVVQKTVEAGLDRARG
ncbi:MAG: hypothetical protein GY928_17810, partial [Colwellia sp.]|nr:hypothetical protein [Colwellia sp.]